MGPIQNRTQQCHIPQKFHLFSDIKLEPEWNLWHNAPSLRDILRNVHHKINWNPMSALHTLALLLLIASGAGYLNQKIFKQPQSLAMALVGIFMATLLFSLGEIGVAPTEEIKKIMLEVDFSEFLLHGVLAFLLFAGAMFFDVQKLKTWAWPIFSLTTVGVIVSASGTAFLLWGAGQVLNMPLDPWWCALFGALMAPTDPIAVMSLLREAKAPESLETKLVGESLFNDAMGIMLFLVVLAAMKMGYLDGHLLAHELLIAPLGAVALGAGLGWATIKLMSTIDDHPTEMLMSLALAAGSYALAEVMHLSAPIAVVVAGLMMGHQGRLNAMSETSREHIDTFWLGLDELLNAMLFLLMGLMLLVLQIPLEAIFLGVIGWMSVLVARALGVGLALLPFRKKTGQGTRRALVWGGLRGGISLALALSLPHSPDKNTFVAMTFVVVAISVLGQGMTLKRLIKPSSDCSLVPP